MAKQKKILNWEQLLESLRIEDVSELLKSKRLHKKIVRLLPKMSFELKRELAEWLHLAYFAEPKKILSLKDLEKSPPPSSPGVYGWYFKSKGLPPHILVRRCVNTRRRLQKWTLLYVGIGANLKSRILGKHFGGTADSSSLRLSLGCLLAQKLGICLWKFHKKDEGKFRYTFSDRGEGKLSMWMAKYARVAWVVSEDYDRLEQRVISEYRPPLNTEDNPILFVPLGLLKTDMKRCAVFRGSKAPRKAVRRVYKKFVKKCKEFKRTASGQ